MTDDRTAKDDEISITRYRKLAGEVTDPFAICLLRLIVEELEAGLLGQNHRKRPAAEGCTERVSRLIGLHPARRTVRRAF